MQGTQMGPGGISLFRRVRGVLQPSAPGLRFRAAGSTPKRDRDLELCPYLRSTSYCKLL